ncbi:MAG TPA: hypothetical protein VNA44_12035 [Burkholderiaceae bacterium]|nr:hypothetical protein [Burkholderiaceae bacterium]
MKKSGDKLERGKQPNPGPDGKLPDLGLAGTKRILATDDPAATAPELRQPNERDESADQQLTGPRRVIKQAHDDLQSGQQDTDARNRVAEVLPDVPKTPQNFDNSDPVDTAPRSKKNTS